VLLFFFLNWRIGQNGTPYRSHRCTRRTLEIFQQSTPLFDLVSLQPARRSSCGGTTIQGASRTRRPYSTGESHGHHSGGSSVETIPIRMTIPLEELVRDRQQVERLFSMYCPQRSYSNSSASDGTPQECHKGLADQIECTRSSSRILLCMICECLLAINPDISTPTLDCNKPSLDARIGARNAGAPLSYGPWL
jgi:hypothetical protein